MADNDNNKYTILISGKLDTSSLVNLQKELDKTNNVSIKLVANITQFTVSEQSIASLKSYIENKLGVINVNLSGTSAPGSTRTTQSPAAGPGISRTYNEEQIRSNSTLLAQYERIVQKVNEATMGAQARITVETNGEGVITKVNALYSDLENKMRNINWLVNEEGELINDKARYTENNIKKQKEQLTILEKSKKVVSDLKKLIQDSNPAAEQTRKAQQLVTNLENSIRRAEATLVGSHGKPTGLLSTEDVAYLDIMTISAKSAAKTQKELNAELATQAKYLDSTKSYAANLQKAASQRAQSIPQVKEAVAASKELLNANKSLDDQVNSRGIPLTKEQIAAHDELIEKTKLAGTAFKGLGGDTKSFIHEIGVAISRTISWSIAMGAVYGALHQIKAGIAFITDLDEHLTNIRLVSGATAEETQKLAAEYNALAKELGTTTEQVARGSLEFIRQGKTQAETSELIRISTMQAKLANMDAAQSTEFMTSIMNGFQLEASDMMLVLDKLVDLDNRYATSVTEIATAMQRSAVSAQLAGVSLEELASMVTVVSSVSRQSAESIGESFKTIFARMQAVQVGAITDEEGEDISNVEAVLSKYNITLRDSLGEFRDLGGVLDDISVKWETFGSVAKSEIASTIAGVRQRERLLILLENYDKVKQAEIITTQSAGLAQERYGIYLESVEAKQQKFKATWEELWLNTLNSDFTKAILDIGAAVLQLGINLGGLIPVLVTISGLVIALNATTITGGLVQIGTKITALVAKLKAASLAAAGITSAIAPIGAIIAVLGAAYMAANLITEKHTKKVEEASEAVSTYIARLENIPSNLKDAGDAVKEINALFEKFTEGSLTQDDEDKLYQQYALLHMLIPEYEGWHYSKRGWYLEEAIAIETVNELIREQKTLTAEEEDAFVLTISEKIKEYNKLIDAIRATNVDLEISNTIQDVLEQGTKSGKSKNQVLYDWWLELIRIPDGALNEVGKTIRDELSKYANALALGLDNDEIADVILNNFSMTELDAEQAIAHNEVLAEEYAAGLLDTWIGAGAEVRQALTDEFGADTPLIQVLNDMLLGDENAPVANALGEQFKDFEDLVKRLSSLMNGDAKESFDALGQRLISLNKSFEDGKISVRAYFDSLSEISANRELIDLFDDTTDSAQTFFTALFTNGISAISSLNSEFSNGDIAITDYLDGLIGAKDMLDNQYQGLIDNADALNLNDEAIKTLNASYNEYQFTIQSATQELVNMSDTASLLREGYDSVMGGDMFAQFQAGAENAISYYDALSQAAWNYAQQSGFAFKDSEGNALESASSIYSYLTSGIGNFSNFSSQMTARVNEGIQNQNTAIQKAMASLSKVISSFKVSFSASQDGYTEIRFPLPQLLGNVLKMQDFPISIPNIIFQGSASVGSAELGDLGGALSTIINPPMPPLGDDIWSGGGGYDPVIPPTGSGSGGGGGQSEEDRARLEAEAAYQDLLKMTIAMLKDRAEQAKRALKEELDAYKKLIKEQKDALNLQRQERRDKKEIDKRTKTVTDLQAELAQLQFDTSEEGIARRLELEEQLAGAIEELEDEQFDQRIAAQEAALDRELELYTEYIDAQIAELDRYLDQEGLIVQEAQALIHGRTQEFYDDLMQWNLTYGSGIAQDVVDAWQGAITWIETFGMQGAAAVSSFASSAAASVGTVNTAIGNAMTNAASLAAALASIFGGLGGGGNFVIPINTQEEYHSGGIVGAVPNLDEQEVFAKLLKGEVVATKEQTYNFMKSTLPNMIEAGRATTGDINVEINIPVAGNLDKTVLPDLEKAVSKAVMSIRDKSGLQSFSNLNTI